LCHAPSKQLPNNTLVTRAREIQLPVIHRSFPIVTSEPSPAISQLNILQLVLIHPEIVAQFMDDRPADLFADSGLAGADRFNILLIKHDVIGPVGRSNTLFLVVGTPWKRPRSSRLCCPDCGEGWFGGISSTRTATLRMRLRNSCGSESSASSTTLTKCSRSILHPLKQVSARSLRVAVVVFVVINVIFLAFAFVFLFFVVGFLSKEDINSYRPIRRV